jgi:hypothetical protein
MVFIGIFVFLTKHCRTLLILLVARFLFCMRPCIRLHRISDGRKQCSLSANNTAVCLLGFARA